MSLSLRYPCPSWMLHQAYWTGTICKEEIRAQWKNRSFTSLTSFVLVPAFFCSFSCCKTRKHLIENDTSNDQRCDFTYKSKLGLRRKDMEWCSKHRTRKVMTFVWAYEQGGPSEVWYHDHTLKFRGAQGLSSCLLPFPMQPALVCSPVKLNSSQNLAK